jgi:hypothetical protein
VRDLPAAVRDVIVGSYNDALTPVFLYMAPLVIVAAILLCFVTEKPLATTIERDILPESLEIDGASSVALTTASIPVIDGSSNDSSRIDGSRIDGSDRSDSGASTAGKADAAASAAHTPRV